MRVVLIGASTVAVTTAQLLTERGHEIVLVESDRARIDALYDELDCSFLHGDGSRPAILKEVRPEDTDALFCLTDNDQANILASLVGRSLGFRRIVTAIYDTELEGICRELKLEHVIVPARTIARYLADVAEGINVLELTSFIKGDARFFSFVASAEQARTPIAELSLPEEATVVCFYRDDDLHLVRDGRVLREGDEVVVLTHKRHLLELEERFRPVTSDDAVE